MRLRNISSSSVAIQNGNCCVIKLFLGIALLLVSRAKPLRAAARNNVRSDKSPRSPQSANFVDPKTGESVLVERLKVSNELNPWLCVLADVSAFPKFDILSHGPLLWLKLIFGWFYVLIESLLQWGRQ